MRVLVDTKDDYLIAYAVVGQTADLISEDKDLLDLGKVGLVSMVSSGQFREILASA